MSKSTEVFSVVAACEVCGKTRRTDVYQVPRSDENVRACFPCFFAMFCMHVDVENA